MFQNYVDYNREYHPYNTRYRNDLHTASYKLDARKLSIRVADQYYGMRCLAKYGIHQQFILSNDD